ncbi:hypothetical protein [Marinicellulosiphila megalodicopiae]|uniref:hypothetical protein n=1 Tax=Marinicellulosiphila megalodicopiae TaxID=2724896 RepID=UPI003BB127C3
MKKLFTILFLLTAHQLSSAQSEVADKPSALFSGESDFSVGVDFSPSNIPFPASFGLHANYRLNDQWEFGAYLLNSKLALDLFIFDIGQISEKTYTLQATRFYGQSFNIKFGLGKRNTEIQLAKDLFELAIKNYSTILSKTDTNYIRLAAGNRWKFKQRYYFDVDWASIDIPVSGKIITSAEEYGDTDEDKKTIRNAETFLKFYPGGAIFKMMVSVKM